MLRGSVGSAENVGLSCLHSLAYGLHVARRQDAIGIEHHEEVAVCNAGSEIPRRPRPAVLNQEIGDV